MLVVTALSFDYPTAFLMKSHYPLLHDLSWQLLPGESLYLQGHNGSGKTTLLKLLSGMMYPNAGHIYYNGCNIQDELALFQQNLAYLGHKTGISRGLTVMQNLRFALQHRWQDRQTLDNCCQQLGLWSVKDQLCGLLSAGQQRRVGLARVLLSGARLWLLDEPLLALDVGAVDVLRSALKKHVEQGGQVVYTSHQPLMLYDKICVL